MIGWFANVMYAQECIMMKKIESTTIDMMPTLEELENDGIQVRHQTVKEIADDHIKVMMYKEKGINE